MGCIYLSYFVIVIIGCEIEICVCFFLCLRDKLDYFVVDIMGIVVC